MEYESRRDADDAYHEMHNKRIGRDDLLKIEASTLNLPKNKLNINGYSGLAHHLLHLGALTPVEIVNMCQADDAHHAVVAVLHLRAAVAVTIRLTRMIDVTVTMIVVIAEIAPIAQMTGTSYLYVQWQQLTLFL